MRWSLIKSGFSRGIEARQRSPSKVSRREKGVWQRRYWEHAIRDDADLARHVEYIHFNPVKHGHVSRVSDWPHSTFHRYVAKGVLPQDWDAERAALRRSGRMIRSRVASSPLEVPMRRFAAIITAAVVC